MVLGQAPGQLIFYRTLNPLRNCAGEAAQKIMAYKIQHYSAFS